MTTRYIMQRHTMAWRFLIWTSFVLSLAASAMGVVYMPNPQADSTFLVIGLVFCVFASFAVAKTVRDNRDGPADAPMWVIAVWASFAASMLLMAWGLWSLDSTPWHRAFMVASWLYLVSSACTVAKMVRDQSEADLVERDSADTPAK